MVELRQGNQKQPWQLEQEAEPSHLKSQAQSKGKRSGEGENRRWRGKPEVEQSLNSPSLLWIPSSLQQGCGHLLNLPNNTTQCSNSRAYSEWWTFSFNTTQWSPAEPMMNGELSHSTHCAWSRFLSIGSLWILCHLTLSCPSHQR